MTQDELKREAARAAIPFVNEGVIGVGSGTTVDFFITELEGIKNRIRGAVASSEDSARQLKKFGIPVIDLNDVEELPIYVDGADEITNQMQMIKGHGGALTREKIIAAYSKRVICIADSSKLVHELGKVPIPLEVIPMATSHVARAIKRLGGKATLRDGFTTDNGNIILDISGLKIADAAQWEIKLDQVAGVVTNGIFALRPADILLLATENGIKKIGKD